MAKLQLLNGYSQINVSASVGANGGVNSKDDVLVVQAMLKFAVEKNHFFQGFKFSEPTGAIDDATVALIKRFQQFVRRIYKDKVSVDGRIDPAVGTNVFGSKAKWTILQLNSAVIETCLLRGVNTSNHIQTLCDEYSQVKSVLGELPIGSLELSLEPSVQGVGSLNFALE